MHRFANSCAVGLLSLVVAGCGIHSAPTDSRAFKYRFFIPATTTCSRIVEFAVYNGALVNVGDCAGHTNSKPPVSIRMTVGQHLYLYVAHDSQGQLSVPASSAPGVLRLIHHSPEMMAYTARVTGKSLLTTQSKLCADTRGLAARRCTLLQIRVSPAKGRKP